MLPKALKGWPKSNKSPNLVTLLSVPINDFTLEGVLAFDVPNIALLSVKTAVGAFRLFAIPLNEFALEGILVIDVKLYSHWLKRWQG